MPFPNLRVTSGVFAGSLSAPSSAVMSLTSQQPTEGRMGASTRTFCHCITPSAEKDGIQNLVLAVGLTFAALAANDQVLLKANFKNLFIRAQGDFLGHFIYFGTHLIREFISHALQIARNAYLG